MGNHLTQDSKLDPLRSFEDFLLSSAELKDKVGLQTQNKMFRSYLFRLYEQGTLFFKIALRRQKIDTQVHLTNFEHLRQTIRGCANVMVYSK